MSKAQRTMINGIQNNERCNICGKKVSEKCLSCLLSNKIASYCKHHHDIESFNRHKPIWVGVYE